MRSKAIILNATIFSLSLILGGQVAFAQSADISEKGRGSFSITAWGAQK